MVSSSSAKSLETGTSGKDEQATRIQLNPIYSQSYAYPSSNPLTRQLRYLESAFMKSNTLKIRMIVMGLIVVVSLFLLSSLNPNPNIVDAKLSA